MSEDRKTRRRFLADLLFAGGAVTAASVLGYAATHTGAPAAAGTPTPAVPAETPAAPVTPAAQETPICPDPDLQPGGAAPPPREVMPSGRAAPSRPRPVTRDPMAPSSIREDTQPEGGARPAR